MYPPPSPRSGSAAQQFHRSPEYIAREVAKSWHAEHPEWTADQVAATYEFLREVYRQGRAWWSRHPRSSEVRLKVVYDEIVDAYLRGERLVPLPRHPDRGSLQPGAPHLEHIRRALDEEDLRGHELGAAGRPTP